MRSENMGKVIKFTPSHFETKLSFTRAHSHQIHTSAISQLNIFRHQARVIPIEIGKTNFEMALVYDGKDNHVAKAFYLRAIENGENLADSYCNLGIIEVVEDSLKALRQFIAALNEDPFHYQSVYNLGCLYLDMNNLELAKIYFQKAITIDSTHSSAYYNLSIVFSQLGDVQMANEILMKYNFMEDDLNRNEVNNHIFLSKTT